MSKKHESCDKCEDTGEILVAVIAQKADGTRVERREIISCSECCEHGDYDSGICGNCGADCWDDLTGRAEAYAEGLDR